MGKLTVDYLSTVYTGTRDLSAVKDSTDEEMFNQSKNYRKQQ